MRCLLFARILLLTAALPPVCGAQDRQAEALGRRYFPARAFAINGYDGAFAAGWFAGQLKALKEDPLINRSAVDEQVYRFHLLPTFSQPISVRVTIHPNGTADVVSQIGTGQGGYQPKSILSQSTRSLSEAEVNELRELLHNEKFWQQQTEPLPNRSGGCDGT